MVKYTLGKCWNWSKKSKRKFSKLKEGNKNPMYGKPSWNTGLTKETDERVKRYSKSISKTQTGKFQSKKTRKKCSISLSGRIFSLATIERMMHKHKSMSLIGRKNISKAKKGILPSQETKRKYRLARIKNIEENYGICFPAFNRKACEYFQNFDKENNTKGQYALYGGGEYKVKELGYFLDYINFEIKLIMEWDERHHYVNGKLREKDKIRQEEIQQYFYDFKFKRIKQ